MAGPDVPVGQGLAALFQPRSIAIVGASDDVTKIGGRPVQFLQKYGFAGAIYPINRKGGTVQSLPAFATVADCPQVPDLAVVAVRLEAALQALLRERVGGTEQVPVDVRVLLSLTPGMAAAAFPGSAEQPRWRSSPSVSPLLKSFVKLMKK